MKIWRHENQNEKTRYIIGTGLGLPIVKSIVEAHDGIIQVESKPDHGSTFYVYILFIVTYRYLTLPLSPMLTCLTGIAGIYYSCGCIFSRIYLSIIQSY